MTSFAGTGALVRLALRRDRVMLPVWLVVLAGVASSSAAATVGLYPTVASRAQVSAGLSNTPALVALYGRLYDPTSLGELAMFKLSGFGAVMVALLAIVIVVRHTRAEEESGRLELLGATVVGRRAVLTAALVVAGGTSLVLALLAAFGLIGAGLPVAGSVAFGLAWAGTGIAFAAVAAGTAQLARSARAATGLAAALLGLAYLLRAIGDTADRSGPQWLSWLSPIAWGQRVRPFAGEQWWVLLVPVAFSVVLAGIAYTLAGGRDLGAGLLPDRPGPASAGVGLRGPFGLAWRLHRSAMLGWLVSFAVLGAVFGNIASSVGTLLNSAQAQEFITRLGGGKGLTDAFLATELGFAGAIASAYGVQAAMRLRAEETALRADPVLASAVGRIRWALSHLVIALAGTAALLVTAGVTAGVAHGLHTGDAGQLGRVLGAALVQVPAAWVLTGVVVAVFGFAPRAVVLGWAALVAFVLIGELGPLLRLNHWVMDVSPYPHVPKLPGGDLTAAPLVWLVAVTVVLTVAGLVGLRRRDIG